MPETVMQQQFICDNIMHKPHHQNLKAEQREAEASSFLTWALGEHG
jgi:hypothetical protein